jgi:hypothetical protein
VRTRSRSDAPARDRPGRCRCWRSTTSGDRACERVRSALLPGPCSRREGQGSPRTRHRPERGTRFRQAHRSRRGVSHRHPSPCGPEPARPAC